MLPLISTFVNFNLSISLLKSEVGLIKQDSMGGENLWFPSIETFDSVQGESELLSPIRSLFIEN